MYGVELNFYYRIDVYGRKYKIGYVGWWLDCDNRRCKFFCVVWVYYFYN